MAMTVEWWKDKVAEDIYDTMRKKEQDNFTTYNCHSTQLWARRQLVDWISVIVENFNLDMTSHHLAVYLLDFFMEKLEVDTNHLYLLAIACICLAVKYEEHCEKRPRLASLNAFIPSHGLLDIRKYTASELRSMELTVLSYFNWNLSIPTCAQFLPYYLLVAVDNLDLRNGIPISSKEVVESYVQKHTHYFQEISLQEHTFRSYFPSMIAASCIAASRICLHLTPTWPKSLELMSGYYIEELLPCVHTMIRLQQQDKQQHSDVQVVPSNPSYYPVIQTPFIESLYKPAVIQTPFMDSLYKPPFTSVEYTSFHDDYNKSVMYAPTKSQVIAVGRES
ncbi:Hypothetical predicted protein [Mytilus galloprovincialis]|uniref:Cyclin-J n=1 Tax=Mytilus galloprovincialis TaxID=29158 RepID=A0A8B6GYX7_MYTGA|nr:Hypothetical predicted protein [Mytilus galloprovincialis]